MKTILVIDDTADLRGLISCILGECGFNILEAGDGQSGLQLIRDEKPDLVVCDVNMPGMDGFDILAEVRRSDSDAALPFILMTGLINAEGLRRGQALGHDNYLVKPFTLDELTRSVRAEFKKQECLALCS